MSILSIWLEPIIKKSMERFEGLPSKPQPSKNMTNMAEKPDKARNAGKGKDNMPRSMPKKKQSSLWEWQRYVKRETQRLMKEQDTKLERKAEKKPLPVERPVLETERKSAIKETPTTQNRTSYREERSIKPVESVITSEAIDDFEDVDELEQDLDVLLSSSDVELDDTLRSWVEPKTDKKSAHKTIERPLTKKEELKPKAQTKAKPDKSKTMQLFDEQVQKARRKRNPKRTREHLIENLLDPVISLDEAAVILNVCKTTVRRYTNGGKLECIRTPGNQRRFRLSTVLEFLEEKEGTK